MEKLVPVIITINEDKEIICLEGNGNKVILKIPKSTMELSKDANSAHARRNKIYKLKGASVYFDKSVKNLMIYGPKTKYGKLMLQPLEHFNITKTLLPKVEKFCPTLTIPLECDTVFNFSISFLLDDKIVVISGNGIDYEFAISYYFDEKLKSMFSSVSHSITKVYGDSENTNTVTNLGYRSQIFSKLFNKFGKDGMARKIFSKLFDKFSKDEMVRKIMLFSIIHENMQNVLNFVSKMSFLREVVDESILNKTKCKRFVKWDNVQHGIFEDVCGLAELIDNLF